MTIPRFFLALLLSIVITFVLVAGYVLYPMIAMLLSQATPGPGNSGASFVVGDIRSTLLITEVVVFAIVFGLLYRRRVS